MFVTGAKLIGAGLATISLLGSGIGIGVVFVGLVLSVSKNLNLNKFRNLKYLEVLNLAVLPNMESTAIGQGYFGWSCLILTGTVICSLIGNRLLHKQQVLEASADAIKLQQALREEKTVAEILPPVESLELAIWVNPLTPLWSSQNNAACGLRLIELQNEMDIMVSN